MIIEVNPENLAHLLARKKIENKYKKLGFSPYREIYEEFVGSIFTEQAEKEFEKQYEYFYNLIVSKQSEETTVKEKK